MSGGKLLQQNKPRRAKATGSTAAAAVTASRKSSRSCGKDAPAGANRSDVFHAIVGHYVGCGWDLKRILAHLEQYPEGIGSRYLAEGRLGDEIARSAGKYAQTELPLGGNGGWTAKAPPEPEEPPQPDQPPEDELRRSRARSMIQTVMISARSCRSTIPICRGSMPTAIPIARPIKILADQGADPGGWAWAGFGPMGCRQDVRLLRSRGRFEHRAALAGPRREAAVRCAADRRRRGDEVRLRLDAVVREKCGSMTRAPFRWYETAPLLLQKGAVEKLIAMARQAEASLQEEFGLPLGLI